MTTTALHVCAHCGTPVELTRSDSLNLWEWEQRLKVPLVVHCLSCAGPFMKDSDDH